MKAYQTRADIRIHLLLLPLLLGVSSSHADSIHCLNDYINNITCVWNSSEQKNFEPNSACNLTCYQQYRNNKKEYKSCVLKPIDISKPALKRCDLIMKNGFQSLTKYHINVTCQPMMHTMISITYKAADHIKLIPPEKLNINNNTVSFGPSSNTKKIGLFYELQWKQKQQTWKDAKMMNSSPGVKCEPVCNVTLDLNLLEQGEWYQARVRHKTAEDPFQSTWSDWSNTGSWQSLVGEVKPEPKGGPLVGSVAVAVVALCLAIILCKTNRVRVYALKVIRGPPIPDPKKFFLQDGNFQSWLKPQGTNKFLPSFQPVDISSLEITNNVDSVAPLWAVANNALLGMRNSESSCQSTTSSFSNPNYSEFKPLPNLTGGNLQPCAVDSPYGPVVIKNRGVNVSRDEEDDHRVDAEIVRLLHSGTVRSGSILVSPDTERATLLQTQRLVFNSPDSGVGSGSEEQASQESLPEDDSMELTRADVHCEGLLGKHWVGRGQEKDRAGSIELCSDYEKVEQCRDQPSVCQGQVGEANQPNLGAVLGLLRHTLLPPPACTLPCFLPPVSQLNPDIAALHMNTQPGPFQCSAGQGTCGNSIEPSGDGYM